MAIVFVLVVVTLLVVTLLALGLAFGRMGCFLNGCCYGGLCAEDSPIAMHFPMYSKPLLKFDGNKNPFSQGTDSPSPAYAERRSETLYLRNTPGFVSGHRFSDAKVFPSQIPL